jgi:large subunit ribosomal protein L7e
LNISNINIFFLQNKKLIELSKLPPVPEAVLKRRKRNLEKAAVLKKKTLENRKVAVTKRRVIFKKAETYVREYKKTASEALRLKRQARRNNNFYVPPQAKVALVIRIRGINQIAPKPRKILQLLRLRQINNAVFVKLTNATIQMLRIVEPYIAYGYPNLKSVKELVYKRGFAKVDGQRKPIVDNAIVEKSLGKYGIVCVEDLVHELLTVGPNFKFASNFLWPFHLNPPRGGFNQVTRGYSDGGDFGNREEDINKLVHRMV